jgi:hypothetical protein
MVRTHQSQNADLATESPNEGHASLPSTTDIDVPLQRAVGGQCVNPKQSKRNLGESKCKLHRSVSDYQEQERSIPSPHLIHQPPTMPHPIVPHPIALHIIAPCPILPHLMVPRPILPCLIAPHPIAPHLQRGLGRKVSRTSRKVQETLLT